MKEKSETSEDTADHSRSSANGGNSIPHLEQRVLESLAISYRNRGLAIPEILRLPKASSPEAGNGTDVLHALTVGRLIHTCEVIGATLDEVFLRVAPHLVSHNDADLRERLLALDDLLELDTETLKDLRAVTRHLPKSEIR